MGAIALEAAPAEVCATGPATSAGDVDLLPALLADIADPEAPGRAVEAEPPWVAQAVRPDLIPPWSTDEGIVGRDSVGGPRGLPPRIDAHDLSEQVAEALCIAG